MSFYHTSPFQNVLDDALLQCKNEAVEVNKRELEWLLEAATQTTRIQRITGTMAPLPHDWQVIFSAFLKRRLLGEPVQYILGTGAFYGREFQVTSDVLIPRPETEQLVEWAILKLGRTSSPNILDIGTGSGCIAVTLALEISRSRVTAIDVSSAALEVAKMNAATLEVEVNFERVDVFSDGTPVGPFELVISNPPYVPLVEKLHIQREVIGFEPHIALFAGEDPLIFYKRIAAISKARLTSSGMVAVEIHAEYGRQVRSIFEAYGYSNVTVMKDLAGKDRFVTAGVD
jgi:release factor glutamine methyltransferase